MRRANRRTERQEAQLTEVEWALMEVVWAEEPCAAGTVQEALEKTHAWAYSTVKTTMDRMVKKGFLESFMIRNLNLYKARISRTDARRAEIRRMLTRAFDGAIGPMMQFLVQNEELSREELEELRQVIREAKRKKA